MVWWLAGSALKHTLIDRLFFNPSFSGVQGDVHVLLLSHVQLRPAEGQRLPEHVHQEGQVSWKSAEMMGCRRCPVGVSWRGFSLKPPWGNISTLPMPQVPAQYGHSSRRPPPADPQQRCCPCAARTANGIWPDALAMLGSQLSWRFLASVPFVLLQQLLR